MAMYWVRVIALNEGGEGEPQELNNYILAMPPPGMPLDGNNPCYILCPYYLFITTFSNGKILILNVVFLFP